MLSTLLVSLCSTFALFGLYKFAMFAKHWLTTPLRDLPGPNSSSLVWGNFKEIFNAENSVMHEKWVAEYGPTLKYWGFLNEHRLYTMDPKAITYMLSHADDFPKPEQVRYSLQRILGTGVLYVEGEQHRQQRRILNPAFGSAQIRELTTIFLDKAIELRDIWISQLGSSNGSSPHPFSDNQPSSPKAQDVGLEEHGCANVHGRDPLPGEARVDVLSWLSRMALDVIGRAGFNYDFNAMKPGEPNELNKAFATIFKSQELSFLLVLQALFPIARIIPSEQDTALRHARNTMNRIGTQLINNAKVQARAESVKGSDGAGKDILSLLVKANLSEGRSAMTDDDVLSQVPTFLTAGHETTSSAVTWALYALCKAPAVQTKLREALRAISTEHPSMDELNSIEYLDWVVRETMRVHAPVPSTIRVATRDTVVPVETPYRDRKGVVRDTIWLTKGDIVFIPILAMNRAKTIWGEDAMEFIPERWGSLPEVVQSMPGVWANMLSFLGGPRSCIGYRFSLVEMKALLFTLVRAFEFELAVPVDDIGKKQAVVQRPIIMSDPAKPNQMPLIIRAAKDT